MTYMRAGQNDGPYHRDDGFNHEGAGTDVVSTTENDVKPPRMYRVLLHNDHYTTMDFVIMVLTHIFHHTEQRALQIMMQVHTQGVGVAGVFHYEIAEARVQKVARLAKAYDFPLRCTLEPE